MKVLTLVVSLQKKLQEDQSLEIKPSLGGSQPLNGV